MNNSPYKNIPQKLWTKKTLQLINVHPLKDEIVPIVLWAWNTIFDSSLGGYQIGKDIFPEPQIMGFFLHDLIALRLANIYPQDYKLGNAKYEKDITNIKDESLSIEIKTSSNPNKIFANRSYAQPQKGNEKKHKDGYFLAINFEKFTSTNSAPKIRLIRFGYLEHSDWIAQQAATGQQAHLAPETYTSKFITLYDYTKDIG